MYARWQRDPDISELRGGKPAETLVQKSRNPHANSQQLHMILNYCHY